MQSYSGPPMHFYSGVDTRDLNREKLLRSLLATVEHSQVLGEQSPCGDAGGMGRPVTCPRCLPVQAAQNVVLGEPEALAASALSGLDGRCNLNIPQQPGAPCCSAVRAL